MLASNRELSYLLHGLSRTSKQINEVHDFFYVWKINDEYDVSVNRLII